jgi:hypothetical protein
MLQLPASHNLKVPLTGGHVLKKPLVDQHKPPVVINDHKGRLPQVIDGGLPKTNGSNGALKKLNVDPVIKPFTPRFDPPPVQPKVQLPVKPRFDPPTLPKKMVLDQHTPRSHVLSHTGPNTNEMHLKGTAVTNTVKSVTTSNVRVQQHHVPPPSNLTVTPNARGRHHEHEDHDKAKKK